MTDPTGPLTTKVLEYTETMKRLVPVVKDPSDWGPLAELVAVGEFGRLGTFLEVQDWSGYTAMLTKWSKAIDSFETEIRRIAELPDVVYFEVEERHRRGQKVNVVNSMTVFRFDSDGKICHLDVYLQQPIA